MPEADSVMFALKADWIEDEEDAQLLTAMVHSIYHSYLNVEEVAERIYSHCTIGA